MHLSSATSSLSVNGSRQPGLKTTVERNLATIDGHNSADLDVAIANCIYCHGLSFSFGESPYLKKILQVAKSAPNDYSAPKRNIVSGALLDTTYQNDLERNFKELLADADTHGLGMTGDGATIKGSPLMNVLCTGFNVPAMVVRIVDCTERLLEGEKKDGPFIANLFLPVMRDLDPNKDRMDILFFDGGSNMQLAGRLIEAEFPRVSLVHGYEHQLSLVFGVIGKIPIVKVGHLDV